MTDQLALDFTLPIEPGTLEQRAVVFTALGGKIAGRQTYQVVTVGDECQYLAALNHFAVKNGHTPDARVMMRTITVGEWRPA